MSGGRTPDDPHVRRLQNRVGNMENRVEYLEETLEVLAKYVQAVEDDTIAEPEVPPEVAERVADLTNGGDLSSDGENLMDEDDRLFD